MNDLEFAIRNEHEGQMYYERQAKLNTGNVTSTVFELLAKDEYHHAEILKQYRDKTAYQLQGSDTAHEADSIFANKENYENAIRTIPNQLDIYREALSIEQKSIELYEKYYANSQTEEEKQLFQFLIAQEKVHYRIMDDMTTMLNRPYEWVESAEFGLREEY